jgi:hypothetical protein
MEPILLVGNSPNQLSTAGLSWGELMKQLRRHAGVGPNGHEDKPFTLHFEELLCSYRRKAREKSPDRSRRRIDRAFKRVVARKMAALEPQEVHQGIMRLPVKNILTTNYDYCLEKAACPEIEAEPENADWGTNDKRYCLFVRRCGGKNKFVFHIHGEIARPECIIIGHEAYVESCSNIRRFANIWVRGKRGDWRDGKGNFYPGVGWLQAKFRKGNGSINPARPHSWVDLFMLRDVHIIGFGLEFTEVDVWYLISYKARLKLHPEVPEALRRTHIIFHYFVDGKEAKHVARVALLKSLGVKCRPQRVPVRGGKKDYRAAWAGLLKHLSKELG